MNIDHILLLISSLFIAYLLVVVKDYKDKYESLRFLHEMAIQVGKKQEDKLSSKDDCIFRYSVLIQHLQDKFELLHVYFINKLIKELKKRQERG